MKIYPNQSKSYSNALDAITDCGFTNLGGYSKLTKHGKGETQLVFEKEGIHYVFNGMDNYNTTIYSINLKKVNLKNYVR